jgi:hypothetical protein
VLIVGFSFYLQTKQRDIAAAAERLRLAADMLY